MSVPFTPRRKKIAIFYFVLVKDNGIGNVNRLRVERLCEKYDFTVFAVRFDNPRPDRVRWVRVPCILRPGLIGSILYRAVATAIYLFRRFFKNEKFDIVQSSDAVFGPVDIADAHFCQRYYLLHIEDRRIRGLRSAMDLLARSLHAVYERRIYRKASVVVAVSAGLRRELINTLALDPGTIVVLPSAVDSSFAPPNAGERDKARRDLGLHNSDVTLIFVSLGEFGRKGLGPLIDAFSDPRLASVRLLVVGGNAKSLAPYVERARYLDVSRQIRFCGAQTDIRPFLWAADSLVLPSLYETFSAVTMQAAKSGLALLTTRLNGVEDYTLDGFTGYTITEPTAAAVADAIARFVSLPAHERRRLGCNALDTVRDYNVEQLTESWDRLYSMGLDAARPILHSPQTPAHRE